MKNNDDKYYQFVADVNLSIYKYINSHTKEEMKNKELIEWVSKDTGYSVYKIMTHVIAEGIISIAQFVEKSVSEIDDEEYKKICAEIKKRENA